MSSIAQAEGTGQSLDEKYLTFLLGEDRYGVRLLKVQEIIKVPGITVVPRCPRYVRGVINLRGKIIPVVDLRLKFGLVAAPLTSKSCVIVVGVKKNDQNLLVGVIVDTVLEVLSFSPPQIGGAPSFGDNLKVNFVTGMATRDGSLNVLIDIDAVIESSSALDLKLP